jgi:putative spermidine/putrescine transport system permease protein
MGARPVDRMTAPRVHRAAPSAPADQPADRTFGVVAWQRAALLLLALSSLLPLLVLVVQSLGVSWRWPLLLPEAYTTVAWRSITQAALGRSLLTSAALGVATALTAVLVALPVGRALATLRAPWRHVAAALVFLPVAAPPIALGAGLQVATLQLGIGGTVTAVWLAHCVPAVGYAALLFLGVFSARTAHDEEAARSLGASRQQVWRYVLLPTLRGPIGDALAICFLVSWAQVALTLVIGGGAVRALPIEVLALVRAGQDRDAAVGALLLVLPAMVALSALRMSARRTAALPA